MARVLVIEDNADNLELMTCLLGAFGHVPFTAADGERGIVEAKRVLPDIILCDVHLPGADGYAVARELKADPALRHTPLVAVTALAMVGDREKGLAAGFDGYLSKPIDPQLFVSMVDRFLPEELRGHAPQKGPDAAPASVPHRRAMSANVLVVDDSAVNRELIDQTLTPFGYSVSMAETGAPGLDMALRPLPDLILSDLHMPGEDGFVLIRSVKADPRLSRVPFIFISSSVWGESDRKAAMLLGVSRFLLRPIEPQTLVGEIRACLADHLGFSHGPHPGG